MCYYMDTVCLSLWVNVQRGEELIMASQSLEHVSLSHQNKG